jgi:ADP-heptose:LPS heptosyltransferase
MTDSRRARILVLRGGAVGDFIVTLPALRALRERWPDAFIEVIGYPHIANLALAGGLVNHVASLDQAGIARFFALKPRFTPDQVEFIRSFDMVITYLHDPDESVRTNLQLAGAKLVIYGSPIVTSGHAIDHLMKPLESLAIYRENPAPRLLVGDDGRERGRALLASVGLRGPVAMHPGSGSPKKNWPAQNFVALGRRLAGRCFFLAGEADGDVERDLRDKAPETPIISGKTLGEVAEILAASCAFVGNDSGITHLAAAIGLPVVALFGSSDPARWGPRGPGVRILRAPGGNLAALSVAAVAAALPHDIASS